MKPIFLSIFEILPEVVLTVFPGKRNNENDTSEQKEDTPGKSPRTPVDCTVDDKEYGACKEQEPAVKLVSSLAQVIVFGHISISNGTGFLSIIPP
jgi:hypothetical protein